MRRRTTNLLLISVILTFAACATNPALTEDQKARAGFDRAQNQLTVWWGAAKTYYQNNPTKDEEWHSLVVPAFDTANRGLRTLISEYQTGKIDPTMVQDLTQMTVNELMRLLIAKGVLK